MEVVIVGGGIGGLTTAMFLHDRGHDVRVFEAVPEIKELGVGINLLPHAMRGLDMLGLLDPIADAGIAQKELGYFNRHGQQIWSEPRGVAAGYDWPQISIHRGRLQGILRQAALERLGEDRLLTDYRFTEFEESGGRVTAQFTNHAGDQRRGECSGDILVAVDGIHSRAREIFYPDEGKPRYSGVLMWRAACMAKPFLSGATMAVVGTIENRFVGYPIAQPDENGMLLTNWIAHLSRDELLGREDWSRRGRHEDFLPAFEDWRFDWLDVPTLYRSTADVFEFPMADRDPLPRWSFGRVTLLGDAAHPMYPIGSNGASQAILDAIALADALDHETDPVDALKAYESIRLPATAEVVRANRGQGPEIIIRMAEDRAPDGFDDIEDVIPVAEIEAIAASYKQTAGFSKEQLKPDEDRSQ